MKKAVVVTVVGLLFAMTLIASETISSEPSEESKVNVLPKKPDIKKENPIQKQQNSSPGQPLHDREAMKAKMMNQTRPDPRMLRRMNETEMIKKLEEIKVLAQGENATKTVQELQTFIDELKTIQKERIELYEKRRAELQKRMQKMPTTGSGKKMTDEEIEQLRKRQMERMKGRQVPDRNP